MAASTGARKPRVPQRDDTDLALAPLFEATEAQELTAEQETAPPSSSSGVEPPRSSPGETWISDAAPAELLALNSEHLAEAVPASDAASAKGMHLGHEAETAAPPRSEEDLEEDLVSLRALAEMAEGGVKVLWPRGYDPSDSGGVAHAAYAADASSASGTHHGHATNATDSTFSDDDLVALRDLVDMADMGAKVVWPSGLDRRTALLAITSGTAARQPSSSSLTDLARRVSPTDAPT